MRSSDIMKGKAILYYSGILEYYSEKLNKREIPTITFCKMSDFESKSSFVKSLL